jgi:hypothetical protein
MTWLATDLRCCGAVEGIEPLTPCMPCHPHVIRQPSTALLRTISILLGEAAGQGVVVRREAACGIAADNLLTGLPIVVWIAVTEMPVAD